MYIEHCEEIFALTRRFQEVSSARKYIVFYALSAIKMFQNSLEYCVVLLVGSRKICIPAVAPSVGKTYK